MAYADLPTVRANGLGAWLTDLFTPRVLESRVLVYSASAAAVIMVLQAAVIDKSVLPDRGGDARFETTYVGGKLRQ